MPVAASKTAPRRRTVVFDFDATLAAIDVTVYGPQGVAAMGGRERVAALDAFLARVSASGCEMGIVSFNNRGMVVRTLDSARLLRHFPAHAIFGYEQVLEVGGSLAKSPLIHKRFLAPRKSPTSDLLFVDDNSENIRDLASSSRTAGCGLLHVRGGQGMVAADFATVLEWCEGGGSAKAKRRTVKRDDGAPVPWRAPTEVCDAGP